MAKQSYKIPASLDENYMNMEIAIQNKEGVGLKPLPVRVILAWVASLLILVYFDLKGGSIIVEAGPPMQILFAIVWLAFTFYVTKVDSTHKMQIELIPALLNYMQKSNRNVLTRKSVNAVPFYSIAGIESIDPDSGRVKYNDGTYGYWYSVVGTASVLLFPQDRDMILDHVDQFYRKITPDVEIIFMTTKEPQKVQLQLAHLISQYKHRTYECEGLKELVKEQDEALTNFVGKEFKSLHQYMIIKGDNLEALSTMNNIISSEVNNSALMFRHCEALYQQDIERALRSVYAGIE